MLANIQNPSTTAEQLQADWGFAYGAPTNFDSYEAGTSFGAYNGIADWAGADATGELPVGPYTTEVPVDEQRKQTVPATFDVATEVALESPYGVQKVPMYNIEPRTEPVPVYQGEELFYPWAGEKAPEQANYGKKISSNTVSSRVKKLVSGGNAEPKKIRARVVHKFRKNKKLSAAQHTKRVQNAIKKKYLLVKKHAKSAGKKVGTTAKKVKKALAQKYKLLKNKAGKVTKKSKISRAVKKAKLNKLKKLRKQRKMKKLNKLRKIKKIKAIKAKKAKLARKAKLHKKRLALKKKLQKRLAKQRKLR